MIDFFSSQGGNQNPTLLLVIYSIVLALVLSSSLAFTYEKTSRDTIKNRFFLQAIVLIAIVAAMVMQAIGDSLARGLGMLGALSIIRFRNTITNPRNIVFIFASLAIGIACGVYGFYVATVGSIGFVITAFVLHVSPLSQKNNLIGTMNLESPNYDVPEVENILSDHCKRFNRTRFSVNKNTKDVDENEVQKPLTTYNHHFQFRLKDSTSAIELNKMIENQNNVLLTRFDIRDTAETI